MKKLSKITATLCVAAIGASMFFACEKESTIDNTTSISNKIQKDESDIFYEYEDEPGVYYWASNSEIIDKEALPGWEDPVRENPWGWGSVTFDSYGNLTDIACQGRGTTCGYAQQSCGNYTRTGIWVVYLNPYDNMKKTYAYEFD